VDDSAIIELFYERSEQAIVELERKYGSVCGRIAGNILSDRQDAEECVNDAYLAVWNTVPPEKPDPLLNYVCRIVRNLAVKRYHFNTAGKRNGAYDVALEEIEECFPEPTSVEEEVDARETAGMIDDFLEALPAEDRILFVRRYWHAEPIDALAELFGISPHNVSVRLSRLRKRLKKYLNKRGVSL
jgi:RNA polymerase sigma-70 factor (ECF subfamily)